MAPPSLSFLAASWEGAAAAFLTMKTSLDFFLEENRKLGRVWGKGGSERLFQRFDIWSVSFLQSEDTPICLKGSLNFSNKSLL